MPAPAPPILEIYVLWHPDDDTRSCTAVSAYRGYLRAEALPKGFAVVPWIRREGGARWPGSLTASVDPPGPALRWTREAARSEEPLLLG